MFNFLFKPILFKNGLELEAEGLYFRKKKAEFRMKFCLFYVIRVVLWLEQET